tara:strand:- start:4727 stop:5068 length:342 start_codon:yes stop_codon:yes gene_type:complete
MSEPSDFIFTPTIKAPKPELRFKRILVDRYIDPASLKLEDDCIGSNTVLLSGATSVVPCCRTKGLALAGDEGALDLSSRKAYPQLSSLAGKIYDGATLNIEANRLIIDWSTIH